jgi:hypothetical protein
VRTRNRPIQNTNPKPPRQGDDLRAGIVASTIVNSNPYRKKGAKAAKASDFVLKFREVKKAAPKPMSKEEFRQAFDGFKDMVKATAG